MTEIIAKFILLLLYIWQSLKQQEPHCLWIILLFGSVLHRAITRVDTVNVSHVLHIDTECNKVNEAWLQGYILKIILKLGCICYFAHAYQILLSLPNIIDLWWAVVDKLMLSETLTLLNMSKCISRWTMNVGAYALHHSAVEVHLLLCTCIPNIIDLS